MKTNPGSQFGVANPRTFAAFLLCAAGAFLAMFSFAADPTTGTLSDNQSFVTYTAGPFFVANPTPLIELDAGPECNGAAQPCDDFTLTTNFSQAYLDANPGAAIGVSLSWKDTGSGNSDYDLYLYKNPRNDCSPDDCTSTDGRQAADYQAADSANPEIATFPAVAGPQKYTVVVVPYTPTGETVTVKAEVLTGGGGSSAAFGGPDAPAPGHPRYQNFFPPPGSAKSHSGEFNIGFNPKSGRIMTMNQGPIWRLTPPELLTPAQPECCEALWEDKSETSLKFGLDPILWTDQKTGRTFASNSTAGSNAVYGYSDNDGDSWTPFGIAAPNGGADHESIGSGPYPDLLSALATPLNQGEAVYYCSQDIVGPAECYRSDDLGVSYGPSVMVYNGQGSNVPAGTCGGLHGHLHVAPDGAVWLPVPQCSGNQGGVFSTDAGVTWHTFIVPDAIAQQTGADPSIAIDADSTIYYAYINNEPVAQGQQPEGRARVQVGHLDAVSNTIRWTNNFDLGATHGIKNAVEIEAVGGSSGRAAIGFIGTDVNGDYQAFSFPGTWYAFIATTYDGGQSWTTVNATPNDPVQRATGVWQQGGNHPQRNLLDFNEITIDDKGRVLYGYSDGCVSTGCIAGTGPNDFVGNMRVARQTGGKTLLAAYDANTDTTAALVPKAPCLSATRDNTAVHLSWKAPDNGGQPITGYLVFRGTASGSEDPTAIGQTTTKTTYIDRTANPNVSDYYYVVQAVNSVGNGALSNEVDAKITPPVTTLPTYSCSGVNIVTDNVGDAVNPGPTGEGPADQADVTAISFSADSGVTTITTTMTIANLSSVPSVGDGSANYYVAWTAPNGKVYATEASVSPGDQVDYNWGEFDVLNNQLVNSNSTTGTYNPGVNGTITVDVPVSGLFSAANHEAAPKIPVFDDSGEAPAVHHPYGIVIAGVAAGSTWIAPMDRAPDADQGINGTGFGQDWSVCTRPNNPPIAVLDVNPTSGADPLTVNFDASGSYDSDTAPPADTIASYTFNFGDGSAAVTQSNPKLAHVYYHNQACGSDPCTYQASLTVTDSRGMQSVNGVPAVITVSPGATPTPTPTATPTATPTPTVSPNPTATPTPATTPSVSVSVSPSTIAEGSTATFTITANSAVVSDTIVNYSMSGKATPGSDYTMSGAAGQVMIPAGQVSATVTLTSIADGVKEKKESAVMTLQSGSGYNFATPAGKKKKAAKAPSATVNITG